MPEFRISNVRVKSGKTKLDAIGFIKRYISNVITSGDALGVYNTITKEGYTIPIYSDNLYKSVFEYDAQIVETGSETMKRLHKEKYDEEMKIAKEWYETLTSEQKHFVNTLNKPYIAHG